MIIFLQILSIRLEMEELTKKQKETIENKINSLVYKLYNLTEEEIKIIEGK